MNRRFSVLALILVFATAALALGEDGLWWGFHHDSRVPDNYLGVSKAAVYEAAIHVAPDALPAPDAKVAAVRLPFQDVTYIDSLTLWFTTELGTENLVSVFVGKPQAGWNVVELAQPCPIPAEGCYVGYSFKVTEANELSNRPLIMCDDYTSPDGLWLRIASVRTYADWYNSKRYGALAIQLLLQSNQLPTDAVAVESIYSNNVVAGTSDSLRLTLTNYGTASVQTLQYSCLFGSEQQLGSCDVPLPISNVYGQQAVVDVPVTALLATGRMSLSFTLTGVNGHDNQHQHNAALSDIYSCQRKAHRRTVMEEYTGTWCSACPRGFAGIARLKRMFPEDFIALSVHVLNGDPMDVYYDYYYVMNTTQFPSCRFDRGQLTDPYDGSFVDGHFHADLPFLSANRILAPADLSVEAQWTDETHTTVAITSTTDFVFDDDECRYKLAYVMTEDSLRGPEGDKSWYQRNSFSDPSLAYYVEDDMQPYVNSEGTFLTDVIYNDVVIAMSDVRGIEGCFTGPQVAGQPMSHTYQLDVPAISQDKSNIHVVCLLIDQQTKLIANAAITQVGENVMSIAEIKSKQTGYNTYFSPDGKRLNALQKGLNIVRRPDGSILKILH